MSKDIEKKILASRIADLAPIPAFNPMKKIQHSDPDGKKMTISETTAPVFNVTRLCWEKVPKDPKDLDKKRYAGGGIGKIKKVYATRELMHKDKPTGAQKIFTAEGKHNSAQKNNAINEARYNLLLGRETSVSEMKNKYYVLAPWIPGMNLNEYCKHLKKQTQNSLYRLPFAEPSNPQLLRMFRNYLKQARIFHDLGLVLKDPKTGNAMVDFAKNTIEIIDFDAVHPIGKVSHVHTSKYLPPNLISLTPHEVNSKYTQADDIYIFGLMLAEMFPKIFDVKFTKNAPTQITTKILSPLQQDLITLVFKMTQANPAKRPTIDECLSSITQILSKGESKSLPLLDEKEDMLDILSQQHRIRAKAIMFDELCSRLKAPSLNEEDIGIVKLYPEFLDRIMPDSSEKYTLLKFASIHNKFPIVMLGRMHALEKSDYETIDFYLKRGHYDHPLTPATVISMLLLALDLKEDKGGMKEKLVEKFLGHTDIFAKENKSLLQNEYLMTLCFAQALQNCDLNKVKKIIAVNKNIVNCKFNGRLPLMTAMKLEATSPKQKADKDNIVKVLLENGADLSAADSTGSVVEAVTSDSTSHHIFEEQFWSVLHSAEQRTVILWLKIYPDFMNIWQRGADYKSNTLMIAAYLNKKDVVEYLLKNKVDIFLGNLKNQTVLDIITHEKPEYKEILALLRPAALIQALEASDYEKVAKLMQEIDSRTVNTRLVDGSLLLTRVLECKHLDKNVEKVFESLLQKGADPLLKDSSGRSAISIAQQPEYKNFTPLLKASLESLTQLSGLDFDDLLKSQDITGRLKEKFNYDKELILSMLRNYEQQLSHSNHIMEVEDLDKIHELDSLVKSLRSECKVTQFNPEDVISSFKRLETTSLKVFHPDTQDKLQEFFHRKSQDCYATLKSISEQLVVEIKARISKYQARYDSRGNQKTKNKLDTAKHLKLCLDDLMRATHYGDKVEIESWIKSSSLRNKKQEFIAAAKVGILFGKSFSKNDEKFITKLQTDLISMERTLGSLSK
jgi:serine/threonine protein kinase